MFGFIKRWAGEANEVSFYQKELCSRFTAIGVNFMELHPTMHKAMLRTAWIFDDVDFVMNEFSAVMDECDSTVDIMRHYAGRLESINKTIEQYKIMAANVGESEAKSFIRKMYKNMKDTDDDE